MTDLIMPPSLRTLEPSRARIRVESRADGGQTLTGYAGVYYRAGDAGTEYWIFDDLVERMMPGAFANTVSQNDDIVSFFNHNRNSVLGRRASGTARVFADEVGLRFEVDLPQTGVGPNVAELVQRGDVPGASLQFLARPPGVRGKVVWSEEIIDDRVVDVREIHDMQVFEVGPVMDPAYTGTTVGMRCSHSEAKELDREREPARRRRQAAALGIPTSDEVAMRIRLAELHLDDLHL